MIDFSKCNGKITWNILFLLLDSPYFSFFVDLWETYIIILLLNLPIIRLVWAEKKLEGFRRHFQWKSIYPKSWVDFDSIVILGKNNYCDVKKEGGSCTVVKLLNFRHIDRKIFIKQTLNFDLHTLLDAKTHFYDPGHKKAIRILMVFKKFQRISTIIWNLINHFAFGF